MTEPVDLTTCDREPIHIPGSIQPHGAMLVCDPNTFQILFASENLARITGYKGRTQGSELSSVIGDRAAHDVRNAAARAGGATIAGVLLGVALKDQSELFDIAIHRHKDRTFVEIERSIDGGKSAQNALDLTQSLIRRISLETDVQSIATSGAKLIRAMLGYDRVMVYQFLHNGAGRVIAEAKRSSLGSFMGQHFPASDIPYQARRLYLLNSIRMIGDSHYTPIAVTPELAPGEAPIDMSFAQLRSVSPIHCEYLQNMGVHASMSISITVDGELWGLISCHHDSPKVVPLPMRIGAELFGQYFSLQISVAERRAQILASSAAREGLDKIVSTLNVDTSLADGLMDHLPNFAALIECDGAALWTDGAWRSVGVEPPTQSVGALVDFISAEAGGSIWGTQALGEQLETSVGGVIAGVLAIPLSLKPRDYLMFFRSEEAHNIEWAGEPIKALVGTPQGERLTPRGSFNTWREDVKGRSKPWTAPELAVADAIRTYLRDVVLRHSEIAAEERARTEQRRRILNDELNHRVKNIIALVKSIALQTGAHASSVADYSASLEGRLRALAFAHDQSLGLNNSGDLATLIEAEASLHRYGAAPDRVLASGLSVKVDDRTFGVLALVIHEMMTNAAKYGALSTSSGQLVLSWSLTGTGDCEIYWRETGGPPVAPPHREGFGTKLIQNTIGYDLGGTADVRYEPGGVTATFVIPAIHVSVNDAPPQETAAVEPSATPSLLGFSILVVEDQALIAMDTEETLNHLGAAKIVLSPTVADALEQLETFLPDAAVLDFNLGAETSVAVADALTTRGAAFIFATGYGDSVLIPQRLRDVPVIIKPVNSVTLAAKIWEARSERTAAAPVDGRS